MCDRHPRHERDACELQFDRFIKPELERFGREEAAAYAARVAAAAVRNAAATAAAAKHSATYGKRKADEEAALLGRPTTDPVPRPEGPAPAGQTWSYLLGDWVAEDHFQKKRKKRKADA